MMLALLFLTLPCDALLPPLPDVFATAEHAMGGNVSLVLVEPPEKLVPTAKQIDQMEHPEVRLHYFAFIFFLVYGTTVAIGTALLSMARKGRYSELSRRETKTEDADSPATSGTLSAAQLQQVVATAFAGTMALCVAATMWSLATGRISRRWGLDWEVYVSLFALSCMWLLVQAAWMARTRSGPFATTAFLEASIGGTCPIISDVYDSLKDVMVAGLCMKSDSYILKFLGVASMVWLLGVHVGFLMDKACILELAGSYAPVLMLTSKLVPVQTESDAPTLLERLWQQPAACCCELCEKVQATCMSTWRDSLLPILYKQVTPTKRRLLVWENIFQAIVGIAYMKLEGGSAMVAILNLAIPAVQIGCTFVFYDCLKRQVAPWFAARLVRAQADANELLYERVLEEVDWNNDLALFYEMAPHMVQLKRLRLTFKLREGLGQVANALQQLVELKDLYLNVPSGKATSDYAELSTALGQLRQLHTLQLNLDDSMGRKEVTAVLQGLAPLQLRRLGLTLHDGRQVEACAEALRRIGAPELRLHFFADDLRATAACLAELPQLPQLELRLGRFGSRADAVAAPGPSRPRRSSARRCAARRRSSW